MPPGWQPNVAPPASAPAFGPPKLLPAQQVEPYAPTGADGYSFDAPPSATRPPDTIAASDLPTVANPAVSLPVNPPPSPPVPTPVDLPVAAFNAGGRPARTASVPIWEQLPPPVARITLTPQLAQPGVRSVSVPAPIVAARRRSPFAFLRHFSVVARAISALIIFAVVAVGALAIRGLGHSAAPHGDTIYQSALTGTISGWESSDGCSFERDGLHVSAGAICMPDIGDQGDVTLTVQTKLAHGDGTRAFGIVFRYTGQGNYYFFGIDADGEWQFYKAVDDQIMPIFHATQDPAILLGINTLNTIEVRAKGTHFDFYVNGVAVKSTDDATYASGQWGLAAPQGIEAVYTNIALVKTK
ncbi:MAG: hypothetical protein OJF49_003283 [Ktedonobacterales bacterium]|nr:MAG: hypothetical protein OJF49_003283 [Ktedonobacterales bacterium]